jgi:hypothetical protein
MKVRSRLGFVERDLALEHWLRLMWQLLPTLFSSAMKRRGSAINDHDTGFHRIS